MLSRIPLASIFIMLCFSDVRGFTYTGPLSQVGCNTDQERCCVSVAATQLPQPGCASNLGGQYVACWLAADTLASEFLQYSLQAKLAGYPNVGVSTAGTCGFPGNPGVDFVTDISLV